MTSGEAGRVVVVHSRQEEEGDSGAASEGAGPQVGTDSRPPVPGSGEALCSPLHCYPHVRLIPQPAVLH